MVPQLTPGVGRFTWPPVGRVNWPLTGFQRLSLETGSMEAFAPARALYKKAGFVPCGPFAGYPDSPNSTYMTMVLASGRSQAEVTEG